MGLKESNLDNQTIIEILKQKYNINSQKITKVDRGTANLFKIDTDRHSYILKEFSDTIKEETIQKEINIINFLKERGINVPEYIRLKDKNFYLKHENHIIIVQKFIEGFVVDNNKGTYSQLMESARILGKIAKELMNFSDLEEKNNWCSNQENMDRINKMKKLKEIIKESPYKEQIVPDLEDKIKIAENLKHKFDFNLLNKMTKVNTHGDYNNTQLIFNHEGKATVIDFEKARKMPISYEIIESYCSLDQDVENGIINIHRLIEYYQEFSKYFKLNEYDLKYAPYIFLIRLANSSYGYEEYNEDNKEMEVLNFAFFRTKLIKYLYENLEQISVTLEKNLRL